MQILIKATITLAVILIAVEIGKKLPSLGGLISVMPLTGALVLVWLYIENKGDAAIMETYTKGAVWGLIPTILFFVVAWWCFRKQLPLSLVLCFSFGVWLAAAFVHQWFLKAMR